MSVRQPCIPRNIGTAFQDDIIPGYTGFTPGMRMGTAAISGTYQRCHQASMATRGRGASSSLDMSPHRSYSPNDFYKHADPRLKTNSKNKSSIVWGDNRDVQFKTMNLTNFSPPMDARLAPSLHSLNGCTQEEIAQIYKKATARVGEAGVHQVEVAMLNKLQQRTAGGQGGLRSAFTYFDRDASGTIDLDEFFQVLTFCGFTFNEDQVIALFGCYDIECAGELDYMAFIKRVLNSKSKGASFVPVQRRFGAGGKLTYKVGQNVDSLVRWDIKRVFDHFDFDKNGTINTQELNLVLQALGLHYPPQTVHMILRRMDRNNSGTVDFEEFYRWFCEAARGDPNCRLNSRDQQRIQVTDMKLTY